MLDDLTTALEITVIGMALVFGAILLLWLLMVALVRLTAEQAEAESEHELELKRRAAIIAVAVALARAQADDDQLHPFPLPPTAFVTAWQAVQRGRLLSQKGPRK
jgi:hypothetical protein